MSVKVTSSYALDETLDLLQKNEYRVVDAVDPFTGRKVQDMRYIVNGRPVAEMYMQNPPEFDIFYEPEVERLIRIINRSINL